MNRLGGRSEYTRVNTYDQASEKGGGRFAACRARGTDDVGTGRQGSVTRFRGPLFIFFFGVEVLAERR